MFGTRKLGKTSSQRKALLRQLATDLLEKGKIETTFYRAKEVQPVVEKLITLGKKGGLSDQRRHSQEAVRRGRAQVQGAQRRLYESDQSRRPPRRRC